MENSPADHPRSRRLIIVCFAAIVFLSSFIFFWRLNVRPLENWDEGIYAEVTREMLASKKWLTLTYHDALFAEKPPLHFWNMSAAFTIFGHNEFAVRFWSALAGVGTTLLIGWWAWQAGRRFAPILIGVGSFLFTKYHFLHAFRAGDTDGPLVFAIAAALYAYWRTKANQRWWYAFAVFVSIGVLVKSVIGLFPVLIVGLDLILGRGWRRLDRKTILASVGLGLLLILPWHIVETIQHGLDFWKTYLGFHVFTRLTEPLFENLVPWYWYAQILFAKFYPFSPLLPFAILFGVWRFLKKRDVLDRLLLLWIAAIFIAFSCAATKFAWYPLPLLPALALLIGRTVGDFFVQPNRFLSFGLIAAGIWGVAALPTELVHSGLLWQGTPYAYLPASATTLIGRWSTGVGTMAILVLLIRATHRWRPRLGAVVTGLGLAYAFCIAFRLQIAFLTNEPTTSPLKSIAAALAHEHATAVEARDINLYRQPAGYFYLRSMNGLIIHTSDKLIIEPTAFLLTTAEHEAIGTGRTTILTVDPFRLFGPKNQD